MSEKRTIVDVLAEKLAPISVKLQSITWLAAISAGLGSTIMIITIGSLALAVTQLPFEGLKVFLNSSGLYNLFYYINYFTMSVISIYVVMGVAYRYSGMIGVKPMPAIVMSIMLFFVLLPINGEVAGIPAEYLGSKGMIVGMIAALVATRILKFFEDRRLVISLPDGVPPFIVESFGSMFSGLTIALLGGLVTWGFSLTAFGSFPGMIYKILQIPLMAISGSLPGVIVLTALSELMFFCGIHGQSVASFLMPQKIAASAINAELVAAGLAPTEIFSRTALQFTSIGGAGSTFGLMLLLVFFAKAKRHKVLGRVAAIPQILNINEPIIYGLPIVLNPIMIIPFISATAINTVIYWAICTFGLMPIPIGVSAMGMPSIFIILLNGCGFVGVMWWCIIIAVDMVLYYPFFKVLDNQAYAEETQAAN